MKAQELIDNLTKLVKVHGNLDVCYSKDDEGNGYDLIHYTPCVGVFEDNDFTDNVHTQPTHICVN